MKQVNKAASEFGRMGARALLKKRGVAWMKELSRRASEKRSKKAKKKRELMSKKNGARK